MSDSRYLQNLANFPKFEDVKQVTEEYQKEITNVRKLLTESLPDAKVSDLVVYRFIKGWKFDLSKATAELAAMLQWRITNRMDEIRVKVKSMQTEQFPYHEKLIKCFPTNPLHGYDKSGQPISIQRIGMVNMDALLRMVTFEQLQEAFQYSLEKQAIVLEELAQKTGKLVRGCKIFDLSGLGLKHLSPTGLSWLKEVIMMGTANYPESLGNMYIVNAPWAFSAAWRSIKPWLKESTQAKIQILGADYQSVLRQVIDPASLPDWLGGQCSCKGGCVPHVDEDAGLTEVDVGAGTVHVHSVEVAARDVVSWMYRIRTKDIVFKINFKDMAGAAGIKKEEKYDATTGLTTGEFIATAAGQLTLTWDNSYSRWTKKALLFSVQKENQDNVSPLA